MSHINLRLHARILSINCGWVWIIILLRLLWNYQLCYVIFTLWWQSKVFLSFTAIIHFSMASHDTSSLKPMNCLRLWWRFDCGFDFFSFFCPPIINKKWKIILLPFSFVRSNNVNFMLKLSEGSKYLILIHTIYLGIKFQTNAYEKIQKWCLEQYLLKFLCVCMAKQLVTHNKSNQYLLVTYNPMLYCPFY